MSVWHFVACGLLGLALALVAWELDESYQLAVIVGWLAFGGSLGVWEWGRADGPGSVSRG